MQVAYHSKLTVLDRPAMLLEGQDALLLPRESTGRETSVDGRAMPQELVHKDVSSIIEGMKPESADEDTELPIKTIDGCLGLKLSATVGSLRTSQTFHNTDLAYRRR